MKMSLITYNKLSFYIASRLAEIGTHTLYKALEDIKNDNKVKSISRRFVFDCYYALHTNDKIELDDLFTAEDITDAHLETALIKAINQSGMAKIEGKNVEILNRMA